MRNCSTKQIINVAVIAPDIYQVKVAFINFDRWLRKHKYDFGGGEKSKRKIRKKTDSEKLGTVSGGGGALRGGLKKLPGKFASIRPPPPRPTNSRIRVLLSTPDQKKRQTKTMG